MSSDYVEKKIMKPTTGPHISKDIKTVTHLRNGSLFEGWICVSTAPAKAVSQELSGKTKTTDKIVMLNKAGLS